MGSQIGVKQEQSVPLVLPALYSGHLWPSDPSPASKFMNPRSSVSLRNAESLESHSAT
jgi:hypothetical protein